MQFKAMGAGALASILALAAAAATAFPLNQNFTMTDEEDLTINAAATHTGATNSGVVRKICRNGNNVVTLSGTTSHPTHVKIGEENAQQRQAAQRNEGIQLTVRAQATGAQTFNVVLPCDKVSLQTKIRSSTVSFRGKFRLQAQGCTGLTTARKDYVVATCEASPGKGSKVEFEGDVLDVLQVEGKGVAN